MKRYIVLAVVVLLAGVAAYALLEPSHALMGYLGGQKFYKGKPTMYWAKALEDQGSTTHAEARAALKSGRMEAVPVLVELLERKDLATGAVRCEAAAILGDIGPEAKAAGPALDAAIEDDDPQVRAVALKALQTVQPSPAATVPALVPLLKTRDRLAATRALATYGAEAHDAVPALVPLLKDEESEVRWNAALTLGKIGPVAVSAVPDLVAALKTDADPLVREHAAEALGDIGPSAASAVPDLVAALKDENARVRRDAARSLGQMGPAATEAIPALKALANDKEQRVREAADTAVRRIEPPRAGS